MGQRPDLVGCGALVATEFGYGQALPDGGRVGWTGIELHRGNWHADGDGQLAGHLNQLCRVLQSRQVEQVDHDGADDAIGCTDGRERGRVVLARRIDHDQLHTEIARGPDNLGELVGLTLEHGRLSITAQTTPQGRARLRIEIDEQGRLLGGLGLNGNVGGHGRLAAATLCLDKRPDPRWAAAVEAAHAAVNTAAEQAAAERARGGCKDLCRQREGEERDARAALRKVQENRAATVKAAELDRKIEDAEAAVRASNTVDTKKEADPQSASMAKAIGAD